MANFIENLGLEFLTETEEDRAALLGVVAQSGKAIIGYYGYPYINRHFGDAQFIVRTWINEEMKNIEIIGMDTHCSGNCVWEARLFDTIDMKDSDPTERRVILLRKDDGSGMVVANIVNADVLPSFLKYDIIKLQMIAFPLLINYYANEDEYEDAQVPEKDGKKWMLDDGTIFPSGFLFNHDPHRPENEKNYVLDDNVLMKGTVKGLYHGVIDSPEGEFNAFIRSVVETQFGDIEIVHTIDQVSEEQRKNLKKGAVVSGVFVISGDAAIDEYEDGFVKDSNHNLLLLRYIFEQGEAERIRYVLAEDACYSSEASRKKLSGRDEIIAHLSYVQEQNKDKCFASLATITSVDDCSGNLADFYDVGTRCIVLTEKEKGVYDSIVFVNINQDGLMSEITITTDSCYHFKLDEQFQPTNPFEDVNVNSVLNEIKDKTLKDINEQ